MCPMTFDLIHLHFNGWNWASEFQIGPIFKLELWSPNKIRRYKELHENENLGKRSKPRIRFSDNVVLLEAAARNDVDEGKLP